MSIRPPRGPDAPPIDDGPRPEVAVAPPIGDTDLSHARSVARLLERTDQPFLAIDFVGNVLRSNPACQRLLGYSADELRGMHLEDFTAEGSKEITLDARDRLEATGQAQRYEKVYVRKDGRRVPVAVVADFYRDERDEPRGYYAFITDLSERVATEEALRRGEERYRQLFDEAPFGYHEIDAEGTITDVNRTECELLGYAREEMVGRPLFDFLRPADREEARRVVRDRLREPWPVRSVERVLVTRDGREIVVAVESRAIRDERGRAVGLRSTMQDVTRRKEAEAALVESERRARALFEGISDAVFVHDDEGRILDANAAAERLLGYSRAELLGLTTRDVDAPEFAAGFGERLRRQLDIGRLNCEGWHRTKDGRVIPVEINTSAIRLGDQTAVLAVIRDITERKALEDTRRRFAASQQSYAKAIEEKNRELTRSEARYRRLTEGSLDAIVVVDQAGRIALFNPAAERTFGYSAAEVHGRPVTLLMPEALKARHDEGFERYLRTRDPRIVGRTVELRGRRKDGGEFPLELSLSAIDLEGEVQFVGSIRDQTERQRMREMLVQSDRLASIGLLSAGVAHEINNPLAYIANNLAVLERDLKGVLEIMAAYESAHGALEAAAPESLARVRALAEELDWPYVRENLGRMLARTREGVQRVANIVQALRGLARTSPPKMESALLRDLIGGALEMIQGRLRRGHIELEVRADALPKLTCVPAQISQVVLNLLVNAIQAVEATGRADGNRIVATIRAEPGEQIIEVSDNGVGIEPEAMPHLFDPFYTTKPVGEGTGLGLSISHGIVSGHGGRIEIDSRKGQGTTFRIRLPDPPR